MIRVKQFVLLFMWVLACSFVNAEEVVIDGIYAKPTYLYEDGSVMQPGEVDQIQIFYSLDSVMTEQQSLKYEPMQVITNTTEGNVNFTINLEPREKQYDIWVYAKVLTIDGGLSKLSNGVKKSFIISEPPPKVPSNLINLDFNVKCKSSDDCVVTIVK